MIERLFFADSKTSQLTVVATADELFCATMPDSATDRLHVAKNIPDLSTAGDTLVLDLPPEMIHRINQDTPDARQALRFCLPEYTGQTGNQWLPVQFAGQICITGTADDTPLVRAKLERFSTIAVIPANDALVPLGDN